MTTVYFDQAQLEAFIASVADRAAVKAREAVRDELSYVLLTGVRVSDQGEGAFRITLEVPEGADASHD